MFHSIPVTIRSKRHLPRAGARTIPVIPTIRPPMRSMIALGCAFTAPSSRSSSRTGGFSGEANACLPHSADRIRPDLWDALFSVAGSKTGQLDARTLGRWLEAHLNRITAGHKLLVDRTNKARPRWSLARL